MRIAIIHHQLQRKGGMETYLFDLLEGFSIQGDEVTAHVYKTEKTNSLSYQLRKYNLSWLPRSYRKFWFAKMMAKKMQRENSDLKLSLMRIPNQDIVICGGTHPGFLHAVNKRPRIKDRLEIYFEKQSYLSSLAVVAHSSLLRDEIIHFYKIDPNKIHTIYPPINVNIFDSSLKKQKELLRKKYQLHPDKTLLLFPSTGHKRKGFYLLLEALNKLPSSQFELVIAGNKLPYSLHKTNIKCLGFVEKMAEIYAAVDFTILPSYYEPFGLVAIESVQCGTPIIISSHVGAKDLITEKEGILIAEQTPEAVRQAIYLAQEMKFSIPTGFAQRHALTIDDHIAKLKKLVVST